MERLWNFVQPSITYNFPHATHRILARGATSYQGVMYIIVSFQQQIYLHERCEKNLVYCLSFRQDILELFMRFLWNKRVWCVSLLNFSIPMDHGGTDGYERDVDDIFAGLEILYLRPCCLLWC